MAFTVLGPNEELDHVATCSNSKEKSVFFYLEVSRGPSPEAQSRILPNWETELCWPEGVPCTIAARQLPVDDRDRPAVVITRLVKACIAVKTCRLHASLRLTSVGPEPASLTNQPGFKTQVAIGGASVVIGSYRGTASGSIASPGLNLDRSFCIFDLKS